MSREHYVLVLRPYINTLESKQISPLLVLMAENVLTLGEKNFILTRLTFTWFEMDQRHSFQFFCSPLLIGAGAANLVNTSDSLLRIELQSRGQFSWQFHHPITFMYTCPVSIAS